MNQKRSAIVGMATQKCPQCRKGSLFTNPNPYNLKTVFDMPHHCDQCGQVYELETGFWTGAMYISYAIVVAFTITNMVGLMILLKWQVEYVMALNIAIIVALYPVILRYARTLYIYMFVKYKPETLKNFTIHY